ncbi:MAG: hypothetical protein ACK46Q_00515 [Hyphomonas sp.]
MTCQPRCFPNPASPMISDEDLRDWQDERLSEARGILADAPHHPDARVILAARVVAGLAGDRDERAEAFGLLEIMDCSGPTGGAA